MIILLKKAELIIKKSDFLIILIFLFFFSQKIFPAGTLKKKALFTAAKARRYGLKKTWQVLNQLSTTASDKREHSWIMVARGNAARSFFHNYRAVYYYNRALDLDRAFHSDSSRSPVPVYLSHTWKKILPVLTKKILYILSVMLALILFINLRRLNFRDLKLWRVCIWAAAGLLILLAAVFIYKIIKIDRPAAEISSADPVYVFFWLGLIINPVFWKLYLLLIPAFILPVLLTKTIKENKFLPPANSREKIIFNILLSAAIICYYFLLYLGFKKVHALNPLFAFLIPHNKAVYYTAEILLVIFPLGLVFIYFLRSLRTYRSRAAALLLIFICSFTGLLFFHLETYNQIWDHNNQVAMYKYEIMPYALRFPKRFVNLNIEYLDEPDEIIFLKKHSPQLRPEAYLQKRQDDVRKVP